MSYASDKPLSAKQWSFVREYLVDKNGTQAAIRSGYSPRTAQEQASRLLSNVMVRAAVDAGLAELAKKTETDADWVRRRLREEAEDFSDSSSHSARVRAIEIVARLNGLFELDNKQKSDPLLDLLRGLNGNVFEPVPEGFDVDGDSGNSDW